MAAGRSSLRCLALALALALSAAADATTSPATWPPAADVCEECSFCQCSETCCYEDLCCQNLRQWGVTWMVLALVSVLAFICVTFMTICYICCGRRGDRVVIQTPNTDRTPLHVAKRASYGTDRQYV